MEKGGHLRLMNLDGKVLVPNFLLLIIEDVSCILAIRSLLLIYVISLAKFILSYPQLLVIYVFCVSCCCRLISSNINYVFNVNSTDFTFVRM